MNNLYLLLKTLFFVAISAGAIISTHASLLLPKTSPTLTVIGLPKGTPFTYRIAPNYTTVTAISTGYTTQIPIYISPQTNTTYHGAVPWQYQGAGTTVTYNGTTYTMYNCPQLLSTTNASKNICSFYYYLSQNTLFDSNQTALLEASNASLASAKLAIAAITHSNESLPYGQFKLSGKYAKAGTIYKNASYQAGDVHFIKLAVIPNRSYASIQLSSKLFNETLTEPGTYYLPVAVYHGCWGISSDCSPLNVTVTIKAKLISPNRVPFNALIQAGANTILSFSDNSSSAIDISKNFSLSPNEAYNFTFEGLGNSNYSYDDPVVTPANILYYIPVNIINTQSTAVAANTPIAIGTSSSGSIIGFNALPYSSYFTQNNFEFFYANGTIVPSWLEAWNTSNEISSSLSSNMLEWINLGANTPNELPASMTSNYIIYMGFAGNVVSSSNTLFNNINTGEAPQLTCANPAVTAKCSNYAEYDNGNSIFSFYSNFAGTTLPSDWNEIGTVGYTVDNGIQITSYPAGSSSINATVATFKQGTVLDALTMISGSYDTNVGFGGVGTGGISSANTLYLASAGSSSGSDYPLFYSGMSGGDFVSTNYNYVPASNTPQVLTMVYNASVAYDGTYDTWTLQNYTNRYAQASQSGAPYVFPSGFPYFPLIAGTVYGAANPTNQNTTWVRVRINPPEGVMPSTSLGTIQSVQPSSLSVSISPLSATYDTGQSISITATASGGTSPYTYQWYNDTTGTGVSISGATSATFTETAGATAQTVKYYVKATDSASSTATSSTGSYVINTALSAGSVTPSSPTIDSGQSVTLTANPSGGTTPYSYQWYSGTSSTCSSDTAISGATSSTYSASPTSNTYYCYKVTDSATTATSATSATDLVTISSSSIFSILPTSNTIYENTNKNALGIYITTHGANLSGWLGESNNLTQVINLKGGTVATSSNSYPLSSYNMSAYLLVEPNEYYKFIFTNATFYGQYISGTSSNSTNKTSATYLINEPEISAPQYSSTAQIIFLVGILISILLLLLVFRILKLNVGIIGGLAGFAVGMLGAIALIYSLQYTSLIQANAYKINAFNTTLTVNAQHIVSLPLASQIVFGTMGYAFILMDFIIGFLYIFLAMLVFRKERIRRKYKSE